MSTANVYADQTTIAVAVDKGKSSQAALKWAVEELLAPGQTITLVHVRDTYTMEADLMQFFHNALETDLNIMFPQDEGTWNPGSALKEEIERRTKKKFEPFHAFCKRKNVESKEAVLDEKDVAKAISEYIALTEIATLVIGAGSKIGLFKKFRDPDLANKVTAATPDFCTVYVVSKGKLKSLRNGTVDSSPPEPAVQAAGRSNLSSNSTEDGRDFGSQLNSLQSSNSGASDFSSISSNSKISGFSSIPSNSGMSDFSSISSLSDVSFTSSGTIKSRSSTDRSSSSYSTASGYSDWSSSSLGSSFYSESDHSTHSNADAMEAELRKLRLELKQKVESYNSACNGSLTGMQKVSDSNQWKSREEEKISQTREAKGSGVALLEMEKDKYGGGMLAEIETQERRIAKLKATSKAEEKMQLLTKTGHGYSY